MAAVTEQQQQLQQKQLLPSVTTFLTGLLTAAVKAISSAGNTTATIATASSDLVHDVLKPVTTEVVLGLGISRSKLKYRSGIIDVTPGLVSDLLENTIINIENISNNKTDIGTQLRDISINFLNTTNRIVIHFLSASDNLNESTVKLRLTGELIRSTAILIDSIGISFYKLFSGIYILLACVPPSDILVIDEIINATTNLLKLTTEPLNGILNVSSLIITGTLQGKLNISNSEISGSIKLLNATSDAVCALIDTATMLLEDITTANIASGGDVMNLSTRLIRETSKDLENLLNSSRILMTNVLIGKDGILDELNVASENIINTKEAAKEDIINTIVRLAESILLHMKR